MKVHEIRAAWRRLLARRTYSVLSFVVLGVGLGTVLFVLGMINGLILKPLPFPNADRLVAIGYEREENIGIGDIDSADFQRLQPELSSFESSGTYSETTVNIVRERDAKRYAATMLSTPMLAMLGVQPILGRGFEPSDDRPGAALSVLLGETVWRTDYQSDPAVLGRAVKINGEPATIVGVMPETFAFPFVSQVWVPARLRVGESFEVGVVALLKSDASIARATSELQGVTERLAGELASQRAERKLIVKPLDIRFVDEKTRAYLWLMFATSTVVLLLACANVSNLQLTQTLKRRRELAVRTALGAGRLHLLREQFAESLLLSAFATLVALAIAQLGSQWLVHVFVANDQAPPYFVSMGVDWRMLAYALVAAVATTALAGVLPAWRASRADVNEALRDGGKGATGSAFTRVAVALVIGEVALTVVLLVGAGTFIRGLDRMLDMNLGTHNDPERMLTARVTLLPERFPDSRSQHKFFDDAVQRLRADPAVIAATATTTIPGAQLGSHEFIGAPGEARPQGGYRRAQLGIVDDHFADTFGLKLTSGRFFDTRDTAESDKAIVIDADLANTLWPDRDPLGQRLAVNPDEAHPDVFTVIGVVASLHLEGPLDPPLPTFLASLRQFPARSATLAITTRIDPVAFGPRLADIVRNVDAETPVFLVRTQARAIDIKRLSAVVLTQVFTAVGAIALLLAAAGLYGVLAFAVEQRTREIGVRRALGANAMSIVNRVGRRVFIQVGLGLLVGLLLGIPWSGLLADPSLHTEAFELSVFSVVLGMIVLVSAIAALVPLIRALRVNPVVALRHE